jgi:hypothetical protein
MTPITAGSIAPSTGAPRVSIVGMRLSCAIFVLALGGCTARALAPPDPNAHHDLGHDLAHDLGEDLSRADLSRLPDLARPFNPCPAGANFIYTIDEDTTLSRFNAESGQFFDVGAIACPSVSGGMPNSMAVDRDGNAWLNYSSGELFRLFTDTLACTATPFDPSQDNFQTWGMSFAENTPGSTVETLFVAQQSTPTILSQLDLNSFALTNNVQVQAGAQPELTGDDDANLFGFFPSATPPFIARIGKTDGTLDRVLPLPSLGGAPQAWGVAAYQANFYVFLERQSDTSTSVYRVNGGSGAVDTLVSNTGRRIVGVGVATCAGNGLDR